MADKVTYSQDMLDPQVLADMIPAELTAQMKFTGLAAVDSTLEGRPGTTVEMHKTSRKANRSKRLA